MANFQVMLKEAQERFNLIKWNRIETQEKLDAFDTELACIRGEVRLLDKLVKEEEEKAKAKATAEKEKEKEKEKQPIPEQKEVRTE